MKKTILLLLVILECAAVDPLRWNDTMMPDFRLVVDPVMFNEVSGASALFEAGRQNYRANGTFGYAFDNGYLAKMSGEYLTQRLGFSFCSKKEHHWVEQGAVGAAVQFPFDAECGFSYSHAGNKHISETVVPLENQICMKKIAGSNGVQLYLGSRVSFWDYGIFNGKIVYDYVKFNRAFQKNKVVQGVGVNLSFDQYIFNCEKIHLGLQVEAPFIAYDASFATRIRVCERIFDIAIYGQRVHGLKSIPSSSRIGIEIGIDLDNLWSGNPTFCRDSLASWISRPAVYMPQVLVMKDQNTREFGRAPAGNLPASVTFNGEFDVSQYFTGTTPLIYTASDLPEGLVLNPVTGKITGIMTPGTYELIIKATNYFGTHSQLVTFNY